MLRGSVVTLLFVCVAAAAPARATGCEDVVPRLGPVLADVFCFHTTNLTTNGPNTTPPDDSLAGLPPFAFTPRIDRAVISPADHTPIARPVGGVQIEGRFARDAIGQGRFVLRLPDDWNGKLVVAGASGNRSEFNGDWAWSDYVVQKGYAYASQNKGMYDFYFSSAKDPLACRLNPASPLYVHFYANDPALKFTRWADFMIAAAQIARTGVKAAYGRFPRYTYAVGTSNGGYQVRRAVEEAPDVFDGGVDWEGTFVDGSSHNLVTDLAEAVKGYADYAAHGFDANSPGAQALLAAGYPPDIQGIDPATRQPVSLWTKYWTSYWELTFCQWQKRLDPSFDTYGAGAASYADAPHPALLANLDAFATTGKIKKPLVTVAGTMDALLPVRNHARAYADKVAASRKGDDEGRSAQYRLYEVQNGNHIETYRQTFPDQLEGIQPAAQDAFDKLVEHVENGAPLPPNQCIPRRSGSRVAVSPAQPGRCASLFVP
jgi:3HB-oligomer hydrolase (3HBOH)